VFVFSSSIVSNPAYAEDEEAKVSVTLRATPGLRVARGTTLAYTVRVENHGDATMAYTRLYLPYDQSKFTLVDAQFENDKDFVEAISDSRIQVYFGSLGEDASRFATLYVYVADYLPTDTVIEMWGDYDWEDRNGNYDLEERTNAVPVLVGDYNQTSEYVWMIVDQPQAPAGTTFRFFSDRFIPGEKVRAYVQHPSQAGRPQERGVQVYAADADPTGRIHVHLDSSGMAPGTYQMLLRGEYSELEGVVSFTVLDG
jgi:hypothetical protein